MKQSAPSLRSAISRSIWLENVRTIAENAVSRYEEAHGPLPHDKRTAAVNAARQALELRLLALEKGRGEVLKSMFDTAESSLAQVVG